MHLRTKALLSAWLIRNPLFAEGDRKWGRLQIPYQLCRSPFAVTREDGGLGDHTMWDTHSVLTGGDNPWSKVNKSCPGLFRRGTARRRQFPNGVITDIPLETGNFRDYYEEVGRRLEAVDGQTSHIEQTGDDMPTHRWAPKGFHNQFEMPGAMPVTPGDIGPGRANLDQADPYALLPLIRDFHIERLKAIIHRNGITQADIQDGYFIRDGSIALTEAEEAGYARLNIQS